MKEGITMSGNNNNSFGRMDKHRVPSGCLIIKKKGEGMMSNGGVGGGSGGGLLGKQKIFETKKEKKRPRLILSDTEEDESSEEDLLGSSTRVGIGNDDSDVNGLVKNSFKPRDEIEIDRKRVIRPRVEEEDGLRRNGFVEGGSGRKRIRMDDFDDGSDRRKLKKEIVGDKGTGIVRNGVSDSNSLKGSGKQRGFGNEFRRSVIDDVKGKQHSSFDRDRRLFDERDGVSVCRNKNRFEVMPSRSVPIHKEKFGMSYGEPIRLQGKNGVLKVMVKQKNTVGGGSDKSRGFPPQAETRKGSLYGDNSNCKASLSPPFYSERKYHEKSHSYMEKNQVDSQKMSSMRNARVRDWRTEACEKSLQLGSKDVGSCSSKKVARRKEEGALTSEVSLSMKRKDEARRGNGTEKQLLRERIRTMLVNEGWTIDFRPRKNRDYQDAVYRSPGGTEYWSILRAYDALLKEREDESGDHKRSQSSSSFTPIPEEVLCKLTRQTRKKIERDTETQSDDKGGKNSKETTGKKSKKKIVSERPGSIINGKKQDSFLQDDETVKENMKGDIDLNTMELCKSKKSIDNKDGYGNKECLPLEQGNLTGILNKALPKPNIVQNPSFVSDAKLLQERKNRKQNRCLLVRSSNQGVNSDDDDYIPYPGKRTVLSWLIDLGTVPLSGKVRYMNKKRSRTMLEGWITRDGIHCSCCSKILTVSKFEIHAGSKLRQPFQNIFIESGDSLFQCQLDAWNNQEESDRSGFQYVNCNDDDPNDDTCGICGDGGDLICCDGCPSTFHQNCLGIEMLPPGDWHCPNCSCSFCGVVDGNAGQGEDATFSALLTCSLCEKKYHGSCGQETDAMPVDSNNPCTSFCGPKCRELFEQLQKLLGVKHDLEAGFSWCLIKRSDLDPNIGGLPQKAENNSKMAVALTVMDECFLPIVDRRSGINLIRNVLYNCGSNFNRLNYSGFYTVVLERGDEIISAATIRIHGTRLAEMPFIGTRHIYRRQGMFRRLLNAIESVLCSLNVERLIIPAISDLMHTWTMVFGFKPLEKSEKQEIRSMNMLMFPDTDLLQKLLVKQTLADGDVNMGSVVSEVAPAVDLKKNQHSMYEMTGRSDIGSITDPVTQASDKVVVHHTQEMNDIAAAIETGGQASEDLSCGIPDVNNNLQHAHAPASHAPGEESVLDSKFLGSTVTNHIEVEKKPVLCSPVEVQTFTEGAINDAGVASVEIAVTEPALHSLAETSVQHTNNPITEYPHTVTGRNSQVTDPEQSSTELNDTQEVKSNSAEACYLLSDVTDCEEKLPSSGEGMAHDAFELNTEDAVEVTTEIVATVEPDPCTSRDAGAHQSAAIDTQPQDVALVENVSMGTNQSPTTVSECRDGGAHQSADIDTQPQDVALVENVSMGTNQCPATVAECNLQGLDGSPVNHDSHFPQMIPECSADVPDTFPDACLD